MKTIKRLLALLLLFNSSIFGQQSEFDSAVDFCNCKLTHEYLTNFTSELSDNKAEKKSFEEIKSEFENCEIGNSIEYSKLSELLDNNNFKKSNANFSKVIDAVKSSYSDNLDIDDAVNKIISGIFENRTISGANKKYINSDKLRAELSNTITSYFKGRFKEKEAGNVNNDENKNRDVELDNQIRDEVSRRIQGLSQSSWALNYLSLILLIISLVSIVIFIKIKVDGLKKTLHELQKSRQGQREDINEIKGSLENIATSGGGKTSGSFKDSWRGDIENKISEINQTLSRVDVALTMLRGDIGNKINTVNNFDEAKDLVQQSRMEILYASIPSRDGFFNESAISKTINPTASFYKLIIIDDLGQKAKFEFLGNDERAVKDATNAPERILRPACKINNALNQNAKRIKTIVPGVALKQNGKWVIDVLAEIEYE